MVDIDELTKEEYNKKARAINSAESKAIVRYELPLDVICDENKKDMILNDDFLEYLHLDFSKYLEIGTLVISVQNSKRVITPNGSFAMLPTSGGGGQHGGKNDKKSVDIDTQDLVFGVKKNRENIIYIKKFSQGQGMRRRRMGPSS